MPGQPVMGSVPYPGPPPPMSKFRHTMNSVPYPGPPMLTFYEVCFERNGFTEDDPFYINRPEHAPAIFSTKFGKTPYRTIKEPRSPTIVRTSFDQDVQAYANFLREKYRDATDQLDELTDLEDIHKYYDLHDIWYQGIGFLWEVHTQITASNRDKKRILHEAAQEWISENYNRFVSREVDVDVMDNIFEDHDWENLGLDDFTTYERMTFRRMLNEARTALEPQLQEEAELRRQEEERTRRKLEEEAERRRQWEEAERVRKEEETRMRAAAETAQKEEALRQEAAKKVQAEKADLRRKQASQERYERSLTQSPASIHAQWPNNLSMNNYGGIDRYGHQGHHYNPPSSGSFVSRHSSERFGSHQSFLPQSPLLQSLHPHGPSEFHRAPHAPNQQPMRYGSQRNISSPQPTGPVFVHDPRNASPGFGESQSGIYSKHGIHTSAGHQQGFNRNGGGSEQRSGHDSESVPQGRPYFRNDPLCQVYIGRIRNLSQDTIVQMMSECGQVINIRGVGAPYTGGSVAFVTFSEEEAVQRAIDRWNDQVVPGSKDWKLVVSYPRFSPKHPQYNPQHRHVDHSSGHQDHSLGHQDQRLENRGPYSRRNSTASQKQHMTISNRYHNTEFPLHEFGPAPSDVVSPGPIPFASPQAHNPGPVPYASPRAHNFAAPGGTFSPGPLPYASPQAHNFATPGGTLFSQRPEAHFKETGPMLSDATMPQVVTYQRNLGPSPVQLNREMHERQRLEQSQGLQGFGNDSAHGSVAFADENFRPGFRPRLHDNASPATSVNSMPLGQRRTNRNDLKIHTPTPMGFNSSSILDDPPHSATSSNGASFSTAVNQSEPNSDSIGPKKNPKKKTSKKKKRSPTPPDEQTSRAEGATTTNDGTLSNKLESVGEISGQVGAPGMDSGKQFSRSGKELESIVEEQHSAATTTQGDVGPAAHDDLKPMSEDSAKLKVKKTRTQSPSNLRPDGNPQNRASSMFHNESKDGAPKPQRSLSASPSLAKQNSNQITIKPAQVQLPNVPQTPIISAPETPDDNAIEASIVKAPNVTIERSVIIKASTPVKNMPLVVIPPPTHNKHLSPPRVNTGKGHSPELSGGSIVSWAEEVQNSANDMSSEQAKEEQSVKNQSLSKESKQEKIVKGQDQPRHPGGGRRSKKHIEPKMEPQDADKDAEASKKPAENEPYQKKGKGGGRPTSKNNANTSAKLGNTDKAIKGVDNHATCVTGPSTKNIALDSASGGPTKVVDAGLSMKPTIAVETENTAVDVKAVDAKAVDVKAVDVKDESDKAGASGTGVNKSEGSPVTELSNAVSVSQTTDVTPAAESTPTNVQTSKEHVSQQKSTVSSSSTPTSPTGDKTPKKPAVTESLSIFGRQKKIKTKPKKENVPPSKKSKNQVVASGDSRETSEAIKPLQEKQEVKKNFVDHNKSDAGDLGRASNAPLPKPADTGSAKGGSFFTRLF